MSDALVEARDGILIITINRPDAKNAMNKAASELIAAALDRLDAEDDLRVGIVTGATVANTQAIMAARDALLTRQGWDAGERGLFGAPEIPVLIGTDAHSAPLAGLRYAGLGLEPRPQDMTWAVQYLPRTPDRILLRSVAPALPVHAPPGQPAAAAAP